MVSRGDGPPRDPLTRDIRFQLGPLMLTPGVLASVPPSELTRALRRHANGDWGELSPEDLRSNDIAIQDGSRLLSAYTTESGVKFWVITEADRSVTTALLPDEY